MFRKSFITILVCILLANARVNVKKLLETNSIKEYNQWITAHKNECPIFLPKTVFVNKTKDLPKNMSYETIKNIERTFYPSNDSKYVNEYELNYYDSEGNYRYTQTINGYVSVWQYVGSTYLGVLRHDHPIYPSKSIMEIFDVEGNSIITPENDIPYVFPVGSSLLIEYPISIAGGSGKNPKTRVFNMDGVLLNTLENIWVVDDAITSLDSQYIALYILETDSCLNRTLVVMSHDAKEIWRETIGPYFDICFDVNNDVIVGGQNTVRKYSINGDLIYNQDVMNNGNYSNIRNVANVANKDQFLAAGDSLMYLIEKSSGQVLQQTIIPENSVMRYLYVEKDGHYSLAVYNSNSVYVIDHASGSIIKNLTPPLGKMLTYKKVIDGSEVIVKQHEKPNDRWQCWYCNDYLIFEQKPDEKNENYEYIVYEISK